jgi:hypothetical protein
MKVMFTPVEIHKYIKAITYLEKSHTCNRNWKQSMIPTPNLFSVVRAYLCCFCQSNQTSCSCPAVIFWVLQIMLCLSHSWFGNSEFSKYFNTLWTGIFSSIFIINH